MEPEGMIGDEPRTGSLSGAAEHETGGQQERESGVADALVAPPSTTPGAGSQPDAPTRLGAGRALWLLIRRLVAGPAEPLSASEAKPPQPDHLRDCLALLDAHPGLRTTTVRLLGPQAFEQGASFTHEHVETEDEKGNARQTDIYVSHRCSNNHWLDQTVAIKGTCWCGAVLCSTPGCFALCQSCSAACCPRHRKTVLLDGVATTYCTRCFWKKYWFW